VLAIPLVLQALAMIVDEGVFHRRRTLPRWERLGHPIDTLTLVACIVWLLALPGHTVGYTVLAALSCITITKDEWVHREHCSAGELWLHSLLFVLHPVVLFALAFSPPALLAGQLAATTAFCGYQLVYWNIIVPGREAARIDNAWYADLGTRWYTAEDTPIALLRAEARHRNPWIADTIARVRDGKPCRVLDLGCGAGFLSNYLAAQGHAVTGLDMTEENLTVARRFDRTSSAVYVQGDATSLPFAGGSFDVVCAMDLLEHVEHPDRLIAEASRVLAPGGLLFFHTFNRNWLANLVVIKGVELFVKNTPKDLHVLRMFLRPEEVTRMLDTHGLESVELRGSRPRFTWPLWRMLATGKVGDDFAFTFTPSTTIGFTGVARRT
jgi:2-polyprenyl-6-hydroxyphenyl methylase/3-demethylubiquinone-9 3-methyltransferase